MNFSPEILKIRNIEGHSHQLKKNLQSKIVIFYEFHLETTFQVNLFQTKYIFKISFASKNIFSK